MQVMYTHCCGLDVHKKNVTACVIAPTGKEIRTFGTMTDDLMQMADWIKFHRCTHVAMESTGVYWKPIYNLLEAEDFQIMVVNAQHMKAVPGHKTDVKDAEWIADLLRHGLLRGSFIPDRAQRELRELIRYRRSLIEERSREVNRIQKVLEGANIKLSSVATNTLGVSGRAMIEAMIQGTDDPQELAEFAKGRLKNKKSDLERALRGLIGPHQKLMLQMQLKHIDDLDEHITKLDAEVKVRMLPFEKALERLDTIPGVGRRAAEHILAEIGTNVKKQFPSASHLCSWAGMAPGNNKSAGKQKSGKTRKGNQKLRSTVVEAARAAARTKDTYLSAQYHRIAARRGANRAAVAVGHTILTIVYHLLTREQDYVDLGTDFYEQRRKEIVIQQSIKRLAVLGLHVRIEPSESA